MTPMRKETYLSVIIYNAKHQTEKVLSAYHIIEASTEVKLWAEMSWNRYF